jgi:hypothetical protein
MATATIHTYSRDNGGAITHGTRISEDIGGPLGVAGEVIPLAGWPTPAMRQATDSAGNPMAWYIGTGEDGQIVDVEAATQEHGERCLTGNHPLCYLHPRHRSHPEAQAFAEAIDDAMPDDVTPDTFPDYAWDDDIPPREDWDQQIADLLAHVRSL